MFKNMFDKLIMSKIYKTQRCSYSAKSYYDVLGVKKDASKKDIRLAFLKLSKQMHPDTSNKKDHDEFVKITQAYNILNKEETKKNYDLNLQHQDNNLYYTTFRQPHQQQQQQQQQYTIYYKRSNWAKWKNMQQKNDNNNYYNIKGSKRIKNTTIILFCIFASAFSFGLHIFSMILSPKFDDVKKINKEKSK